MRPLGPSRGRRPLYTAEVSKYLVKAWAILDCPRGKRLVAAMPHTSEVLERFGEMRLKEEMRKRLLPASATTCDRLLSSERRKFHRERNVMGSGLGAGGGKVHDAGGAVEVRMWG
ncbi:MAG: hypothetical protein H5T72_05540 [Actinobacteria bacterium]|nr:hypothetical protein [Actinomycetota bacterium]